MDEFFDAAGMPLLEGYGMTEGIVVIAMRDPHRRMLRTTGHVIAGMEHRLVGEDGRPCRPGDVGRLQVRGPNIMRGYYRDPERTAEVLSEDGWFDTRDLALVHADGSLRVLGRLDDTLVLTNGENVNAPYLENELCASEWIDRAVVVGEGRPYVAAFVAPSRTHLETLARSLGLDPATRLRSSPTSASSSTTARWSTPSVATRAASRPASACTACACGSGSSASAASSPRPSSCGGRSSCACTPARSTSCTRAERRPARPDAAPPAQSADRP